jgi:hypothetical protein
MGEDGILGEDDGGCIGTAFVLGGVEVVCPDLVADAIGPEGLLAKNPRISLL